MMGLTGPPPSHPHPPHHTTTTSTTTISKEPTSPPDSPLQEEPDISLEAPPFRTNPKPHPPVTTEDDDNPLPRPHPNPSQGIRRRVPNASFSLDDYRDDDDLAEPTPSTTLVPSERVRLSNGRVVPRVKCEWRPKGVEGVGVGTPHTRLKERIRWAEEVARGGVGRSLLGRGGGGKEGEGRVVRCEEHDKALNPPTTTTTNHPETAISPQSRLPLPKHPQHHIRPPPPSHRNDHSTTDDPFWVNKPVEGVKELEVPILERGGRVDEVIPMEKKGSGTFITQEGVGLGVSGHDELSKVKFGNGGAKDPSTDSMEFGASGADDSFKANFKNEGVKESPLLALAGFGKSGPGDPFKMKGVEAGKVKGSDSSASFGFGISGTDDPFSISSSSHDASRPVQHKATALDSTDSSISIDPFEFASEARLMEESAPIGLLVGEEKVCEGAVETIGVSLPSTVAWNPTRRDHTPQHLLRELSRLSPLDKDALPLPPPTPTFLKSPLAKTPTTRLVTADELRQFMEPAEVRRVSGLRGGGGDGDVQRVIPPMTVESVDVGVAPEKRCDVPHVDERATDGCVVNDAVEPPDETEDDDDNDNGSLRDASSRISWWALGFGGRNVSAAHLPDDTPDTRDAIVGDVEDAVHDDEGAGLGEVDVIDWGGERRRGGDDERRGVSSSWTWLPFVGGGGGRSKEEGDSGLLSVKERGLDRDTAVTDAFVDGTGGVGGETPRDVDDGGREEEAMENPTSSSSWSWLPFGGGSSKTPVEHHDDVVAPSAEEPVQHRLDHAAVLPDAFVDGTGGVGGETPQDVDDGGREEAMENPTSSSSWSLPHLTSGGKSIEPIAPAISLAKTPNTTNPHIDVAAQPVTVKRLSPPKSHIPVLTKPTSPVDRWRDGLRSESVVGGWKRLEVGGTDMGVPDLSSVKPAPLGSLSPHGRSEKSAVSPVVLRSESVMGGWKRLEVGGTEGEIGTGVPDSSFGKPAELVSLSPHRRGDGSATSPVVLRSESAVVDQNGRKRFEFSDGAAVALSSAAGPLFGSSEGTSPGFRSAVLRMDGHRKFEFVGNAAVASSPSLHHEKTISPDLSVLLSKEDSSPPPARRHPFMSSTMSHICVGGSGSVMDVSGGLVERLGGVEEMNLVGELDMGEVSGIGGELRVSSAFSSVDVSEVLEEEGGVEEVGFGGGVSRVEAGSDLGERMLEYGEEIEVEDGRETGLERVERTDTSRHLQNEEKADTNDVDLHNEPQDAVGGRTSGTSSSRTTTTRQPHSQPPTTTPHRPAPNSNRTDDGDDDPRKPRDGTASTPPRHTLPMTLSPKKRNLDGAIPWETFGSEGRVLEEIQRRVDEVEREEGVEEGEGEDFGGDGSVRAYLEVRKVLRDLGECAGRVERRGLERESDLRNRILTTTSDITRVQSRRLELQAQIDDMERRVEKAKDVIEKLKKGSVESEDGKGGVEAMKHAGGMVGEEGGWRKATWRAVGLVAVVFLWQVVMLWVFQRGVGLNRHSDEMDGTMMPLERGRVSGLGLVFELFDFVLAMVLSAVFGGGGEAPAAAAVAGVGKGGVPL
ncbi:hypothetical protein HDU67_008713 [Dinochytrium kinnereticum]|nr:hypothetical protein HDU67_008713 [Dinochytrium kinnereticum]